MISVAIPSVELPTTQDLPTHLIYEMAEKPIYYQGYQDVLRGLKKPEEIMGSSFLQSFLISILFRYLIQHLPQTYIILTK